MTSTRCAIAICSVLLLAGGSARAQCTDSDGDAFFVEETCAGERDCNDAAAGSYPGAVEACDSYDNDCDARIDEDAGCALICPVPVPGAASYTTSTVIRPPDQRIVAGAAGFAATSFSLYNTHWGQAVEFDLIGTVPGHAVISSSPDLIYTVPDLVWTGSQFGAAFLERDVYTPIDAVHFVRLTPAGVLLGHTVLSFAYASFIDVAVAWNGSEYGVFYSDSTGTLVQRISSGGATLGAPALLSVQQSTPAVVWNGSEYLVALRTATSLELRRVSAQGVPIGSATTLVPASVRSVDVVWNGEEYGVTWSQSGTTYFRRVSSAAVPLGAAPVLVAAATGPPRLAWNGAEYALVVDNVSGGVYGVRLYRIDASGAILGDTLVAIDNGHADVAWNGASYGVAYVGRDCPTCGERTIFQPVTCGCSSADTDGDGVSSCAGDCDDTSASVYPGAPQACDGRNNDCAAGWSLVPAAEADADADGFFACQGDCDDSLPSRNPAATEICNGVDDDCDGATDENAQLEICNGVDDDCDGATDEDAQGADSDADGVANLCDNCPQESNEAQSDVDDDGEGDVCDLNDGLILLSRRDSNHLDWQVEQGATSFNVYEGDLAILAATGVYTQAPGSNPLAQRTCGLSGPSLDDFDNPAVASIQFALVTEVTGATEGSLGQDSEGVPRANTNPCP